MGWLLLVVAVGFAALWLQARAHQRELRALLGERPGTPGGPIQADQGAVLPPPLDRSRDPNLGGTFFDPPRPVEPIQGRSSTPAHCFGPECFRPDGPNRIDTCGCACRFCIGAREALRRQHDEHERVTPTEVSERALGDPETTRPFARLVEGALMAGTKARHCYGMDCLGRCGCLCFGCQLLRALAARAEYEVARELP